jgi:hypothetical protein
LKAFKKERWSKLVRNGKNEISKKQRKKVNRKRPGEGNSFGAK